ncbi:MAG: membrane protein insertion efficiency factor YidD [Acidobacteriota bacterium]|nr:membrane protein insertion efficiency factor YidD [Acidobacteriota bacterium]
MSELLTTRNRLNKYLVRLVVMSIENIWQKHLSKHYAKKMNCYCRFYPTCSEYAAQSFDKFGLWKGFKKSVDRVKRCNFYNTDSCVDLP